MDPELHGAAEMGNWDVIQLFGDELDTQQTPNKDTVLHVLSLFRDSSTVVGQVLARKPKLLLKLNAQKETALHIAARKGHSNVVRVVIECIKREEECRSVVSYRNVHGNLALHEAIKNNHREILELLFQDPILKAITKKEKEGLLYLAVEKGDEDLVNLILSTYEPFSQGSRSFIGGLISILSEEVGLRGLGGKTALHAAAIRNFPGCLIKILDQQPHLVTEVDNRGWTALHYAARFDHREVAKILLDTNWSVGYIQVGGKFRLAKEDKEKEEKEADEGARSTGQKPTRKFKPGKIEKDGNETALHVAVTCGHKQTIEELLAQCPDCWSMVTRRGKNVIHLAVENERQEVLDFFLRKPWASELVNSMDAEGNTPLHLYVATEKLSGRMLVNYPAVEINALNKAGLTPLDLIITNAADHDEKRQDFLKRELEETGAIQGDRNIISIGKGSKAPEGPSIEKLNRMAETYQVVATLIITISFAAGFAIPGGYENDGAKKGQPVFLKKAAFIAFITCDVTAMMFSLVALLNLLLLFDTISRKDLQRRLKRCGNLITCALMALVVSFMTGLYVALPNMGFRIFLFFFICICGFPFLLKPLGFYGLLSRMGIRVDF